jgi:hypothetical protein
MPVTGPIKLSEKDTLPGTQNQIAVFDEQCLGIAQERGLDMRRGVALPVAVFIVLGNHHVQLCRNIGGDVRVGMFIDHDSGGGMGHKNVTDAAFNPAGGDNVSHPGSNILKLYPRCSFYVYFFNQACLQMNIRLLSYTLTARRATRQAVLTPQYKTG